MKIDKVHIHDQDFFRGHRYWWTANCYFENECVEMVQAHPMGMTRDSALESARAFAQRIGAEFVEPIERADPCY